MLRQFKRFCWVLGLAATLPSAWGFSLLGPWNEAYQVPDIGYHLPSPYADIGAPKDLGEEYRRTTPVMYYTCDETFLDYYGTTGLNEIDKAFHAFDVIFHTFPNETNVSSFSSDLSEFPTETTRVNGKAYALGLVDLKSEAMYYIAEQLGFASPERYVWTLHDRYLPSGATCPSGEEYLVIQRSFDPVVSSSSGQFRPSSYINDVLYSYYIEEFCNTPIPPVATTVPYPVDPTVYGYSTVASGNTINLGCYLTGLTRDDVGTIRYMLRAANFNTETAPATAAVYHTNDPIQLQTFDLGQLAAVASTNNAAALALFYPDLVVSSSSNYWVKVTNVVVTLSFLTNSPYDPIGTPPSHPIYSSNIFYTLQQRYVHTFANAYFVTNISPIPGSNHFVAMPLTAIPTNTVHGVAATQSFTMTNALNPYTPVNSTTVWEILSAAKFFTTNVVAGDFFTLPATNCGIAIDSLSLSQPEASVQVLVSWTNIVTVGGSTNTTGGTGNNGGTGGTGGTGGVLTFTNAYVQYLYTFSTNRIYQVRLVDCLPDTPTLRAGMESWQFVRRDYDSLTGRLWYPVTNEYSVSSLTNGMLVSQTLRRVVTTPDIVFGVEDLSAGPAGQPTVMSADRTTPNYASDNAAVGGVVGGTLAGPGTIDPPLPQTFVKLNKVVPIYAINGPLNTNSFMNESTQLPVYAWGTFDGTTNEPVVYPNSVSISQLEQMQQISMSPVYFNDGYTGVGMTNVLSAKILGVNSDWTWSLAPGSAGLPPGLGLSTRADNHCGIISGKPTQPGVYDFEIEARDTAGHVLDRGYTIKINY